MEQNLDITRQIKQITPFESGWTFNYLYFDGGSVKIASLPIVGQALVEWTYPAGDLREENEIETHIEAVCLEENQFKAESFLEANHCYNTWMLGIKRPGEQVTPEDIEDGTQSYKRILEFKRNEKKVAA
jgi:hypothetical protein